VLDLKAIEIAWTDEICFGCWEMKAMLLDSLGIFPSTCAFIIDEIEITFLQCPYQRGVLGVRAGSYRCRPNVEDIKSQE